MSMSRETTFIEPVPPFDFDLTAGYHTYFQGRYGSDSLERRRVPAVARPRRQSAGWRRSHPWEAWTNPGYKSTFRVNGWGPKTSPTRPDASAGFWERTQDLGPFYSMASRDHILSSIAERFRGLHLPHTATVFEALVLAILGQQISTQVARVIRTLLIETYGPRLIADGVTYYAFPRPDRLAEAPVEELRGLKLSWRKAEYVRGIAVSALEEAEGLEYLHRLDDGEVISRVTSLRGVGPWTAQWAVGPRTGQGPTRCPLGIWALRRTVSNLGFGGQPVNDKEVEEYCQRWSPWPDLRHRVHVRRHAHTHGVVSLPEHVHQVLGVA